MSVAEYKDGKYVASWDFECPLCEAMWNYNGDPIHQDESIEEDCPKCEANLVITASWSVDYDVQPKIVSEAP